jgi:hypothetical protein
MPKTVPIIAIFSRNIFFSEIINLLNDEGLKLTIEKNFANLEISELKNSILIIDIESEKTLKKAYSFLTKLERSSYVLGILRCEIKSLRNIENFKIFHRPIVFGEFFNSILNLSKNIKTSDGLIKLKHLIYHPKKSKFISQINGRIINLTELENKFVEYLLGKKTGSTKSEILSNVWKHNTELETHTLESLIYRLRRKIEQDPNSPEFLIQIEKKYFLTGS